LSACEREDERVTQLCDACGSQTEATSKGTEHTSLSAGTAEMADTRHLLHDPEIIFLIIFAEN